MAKNEKTKRQTTVYNAQYKKAKDRATRIQSNTEMITCALQGEANISQQGKPVMLLIHVSKKPTISLIWYVVFEGKTSRLGVTTIGKYQSQFV